MAKLRRAMSKVIVKFSIKWYNLLWVFNIWKKVCKLNDKEMHHDISTFQE
jgi:hypothetical protein